MSHYIPSSDTRSAIRSLSSMLSALLSLVNLKFLSFNDATIDLTCSISLSLFCSVCDIDDVIDDVIPAAKSLTFGPGASAPLCELDSIIS